MDLNIVVVLAIFLSVFIISLSFHEAAHAFVAYWLGDDTPMLQKRTTLNPIRHISLMGLAIPAAAILMRSPLLFGWGKPVQVRHDRLRFGRFGIIAVAMAGPFMNIALCIVAAIAHILLATTVENSNDGFSFWLFLLDFNAALAVFNLLPFPPLDGATIVSQILPNPLKEFYEDYIVPYGFYILLALLISGRFSWIAKASNYLGESILYLVQYCAEFI